MKRVYMVIELADSSSFDPQDESVLDELAEDLLAIAPGVSATVVYASLQDLIADGAAG